MFNRLRVFFFNLNVALALINLVLSALVYFGKDDTGLAVTLLRLASTAWLFIWIDFLAIYFLTKSSKKK
jgi:hypothetical protein